MSLGIYIQVPFCQTKCTYCNFHTGVFSKSLYEPYLEAVCREIRNWKQLHAAAWIEEGEPARAGDSAVDTIYIGGGTPSLFEAAALGKLVTAVRESFHCDLREVTLEADPETITGEKADGWLAAGINRISLGAQSFMDAELQAAGRMHRLADLFMAVKWLRGAGFKNVSFDLIAGLPHQSAASWEDSLGELMRIRPAHVSIYMMEIDEESRLGREVLSGGSRYSAAALPSDDSMVEFYEAASERLASCGYEHYEISNWALPGMRSRHNLKYWRREPYFGFGAGAHSFDGRARWANLHDPKAYVSAIASGSSALEMLGVVTDSEALDEELFLGLRQLEGIDLTRIEKQYNVSLHSRIEALRDRGLLELEGSRVRLAAARLAVSNAVFVELMS
ncbi:MAG: radical SAM family heme chaperone HemW [Candidatus Acidiferrales bacterium]